MNQIKKKVPNLFCIHYNQCDPKKCTILKLKRFKLIKLIDKIKGNLRNAILLNPFSQIVLKSSDRERIMNFGLIIIDCSWRKIFDFGTFRNAHNRRLPPLIASNPTNYGKWEKLSSVEALAAALYITNFRYLANLLLSKFNWGPEFKKINNF